jgi:hypothetical protein
MRNMVFLHSVRAIDAHSMYPECLHNDSLLSDLTARECWARPCCIVLFDSPTYTAIVFGLSVKAVDSVIQIPF